MTLPENATQEDATSRITRILTVDDHQLLREGVNAIISTQPDMRVVAEADNGLDAIEA
jgi:DNA-binding NarL/FixJ family response regulator